MVPEALLKNAYLVYQIVKRQALAIDEGLPHGLIIRTPFWQEIVRRTNLYPVWAIAVVIHILQAVIFPSVLYNCLVQILSDNADRPYSLSIIRSRS